MILRTNSAWRDHNFSYGGFTVPVHGGGFVSRNADIDHRRRDEHENLLAIFVAVKLNYNFRQEAKHCMRPAWTKIYDAAENNLTRQN